MNEGDVIDNGRYRIEKLLGQGGMGQVYRGFDTKLSKQVAIKVLFPNTPDIVIKRFHAEAVALAALNHPNILNVSDFGQAENGQLYLVMDYIKGESLSTLIEKRGAQTFFDVLPIFEKICRGLRYAHQKNVLHRDIKPSNVMLASDRTKEDSVKIVDFGLAKIADKDFELTKVGTTMGSPAYMSPETVQGKETDHRSEIYSLGCTLFEMVAGVPPLSGDTPFHTMMAQVNRLAPTLSEVTGKNYDEEVEEFVAKCLKKSVNERFQTMDELITELERVKRTLLEKRELSLGSLASGVYASGSFLANKVMTSNKLFNVTIGGISALGFVIAVGVVIWSILNFQEQPKVELVDDSFTSLGKEVDRPDTEPIFQAPKQKERVGASLIQTTACPEQVCRLSGPMSDEEFLKALKPYAAMHAFELDKLRVSDQSLNFLLQLPAIDRLHLFKTPITPVLQHAILQMPSLAHLRIVSDTDVDIPAGFLESLAKTKIRSLDIKPGVNYPRPGETVSKIKSLDTIWIRDTNFTRDDISTIVQNLHELRGVGFWRCRFSEDAFADLKKAKHYDSFACTTVNLSPRQFEDIARLPDVQTLDFHTSNMTDDDLKKFAACKKLTNVLVSDTRVTDDGIKALRQSVPGIQRVLSEEVRPAFAELY